MIKIKYQLHISQCDKFYDEPKVFILILNCTTNRNNIYFRVQEAANEEKQIELKLKLDEAKNEIEVLKIKLQVETVAKLTLRERIHQLQDNPQKFVFNMY